jgi:hypothetical protein
MDTLAARRARREQRLRVALASVIGALAFAAFTPADLGQAVHAVDDVELVSATIPAGCEHGRGGGYMLPRCAAAEAAVPHRPYAWR